MESTEITTMGTNTPAVISMAVENVGDCLSSTMNCIPPSVVFNAANQSDYKLNEMLGKTINLAGFYIERVQFTKRDSGEVVDAPKVVLIDSDGVSYGCTSLGIYHTLSRMVSAFGAPSTWNEPIPVEVRQIQRGERRTFTLYVK